MATLFDRVTALLAKVGTSDINPNLATLGRTMVVLVLTGVLTALSVFIAESSGE